MSHTYLPPLQPGGPAEDLVAGNEADRWFHEATGIRLPSPTFGAETHRVYDRLAYEIAFGHSKPEDWVLGDDPQAFLHNLGGVLAIPHELAKVF